MYRELEMLGLGNVEVGVGPFYPTGCNIFSFDESRFCDQMRVVNRVDHWRIDNLYGIKNTRLPYSERFAIFEDQDGTQTLPEDAVEVYKKYIDMGVTTVITNGPYTSLHAFKEMYPESFAKIQTLYSMAGNVDVLGNVYTLIGNDVAEFNVAADTAAAYSIVANSSIPEVRLVTLDGTNFVPVSREWLADMATIDNFEAEFILDLTEQSRDNWFSGPDGFFGELPNGEVTEQSIADGYFLWDPLAAVLLTQPDLANWNYEKLTVTTSIPIDLNTDGQFLRSEAGKEVYYTMNLTEANAEFVRDEIVAVLNRTCITDQRVPLSAMFDVYERLAFEYGYVDGSVWVPNSCDSDLTTVAAEEMTAMTCPAGYSCMPTDSRLRRRNLRFGHFSPGPSNECVPN